MAYSIKLFVEAQVDDRCTPPTLLAVVVPIGCTVIALVLLISAILCIVVAVKKCPDRRPKVCDDTYVVILVNYFSIQMAL